MKFCFGDIVVVDGTCIGVICKSWIRDNKEIIYEVYVRSYSCIKKYKEKDIERYMVRHKELNDEEIEYQKEALNPYISQKEIDWYSEILNKLFE
jgi:hypothetical protein